MAEKKNNSVNYDSKRKSSRFAWVRKLIQSRSNSVSNKQDKDPNGKSPDPIPSSDNSLSLKTQDNKQSRLGSNNSPTVDDTTAESTTKSVNSSSKAESIAHESLTNKPDNTSTMPVRSLSTMSIRSSTFSENSNQSTSPTMASEHPTLFTNASTMGIAPASIFDRRERRSQISRSGISSHLYITSNNASNHTLATTDSFTSLETPQADIRTN